jgi:HAE1 family hydrophobic/amphiphilic exporter-1/multidrug efflux pump
VPWHERKATTPQVVGDFFMKTGHIKEGLALAFGPPAIFGLGTAGGFEFYIQNRGTGGPQQMGQALGQFLAAAQQEKKLGFVQTLWRAQVPQLSVDVDRDKAKALGVPLEELYGTLAATLGTYYVNDFNKFGRTWQVLMSAAPEYRNRPDDVGKVWVRSTEGANAGSMIPLASLARVRYSSGPDSLDRFNNLPAVKIFGSAAPGVSSGEAIQLVENVAAKALPGDFSYDWGGTSYQEKRSAGTAGLALGLAVLMVFFILAAQYEKWSLPLSVLLALPFGTFGALAAIWVNNLLIPVVGARPLSNDVYFQIGLVTLLGLAAKNAILIVEFAVLKRDEGLSASAAAVEAARLRFRPILMTFARVHPRRHAARVLERCGRRRAPLGRYGRDGRHDRRHVPRNLLRADVLQAVYRSPSDRETLDRGHQGEGEHARTALLKRSQGPHHAPHHHE